MEFPCRPSRSHADGRRKKKRRPTQSGPRQLCGRSPLPVCLVFDHWRNLERMLLRFSHFNARRTSGTSGILCTQATEPNCGRTNKLQLCSCAALRIHNSKMIISCCSKFRALRLWLPAIANAPCTLHTQFVRGPAMRIRRSGRRAFDDVVG